MKKDGIQTRNRKMSTKSKKKCKGLFGSIDLMRDSKSFSSFASATFNPAAIHHHAGSMSPYVNPQPFPGTMCGGYPPPGSHQHHHNSTVHQQIGPLGHGFSMGPGFNNFQSPFSSIASGLSYNSTGMSMSSSNGFLSPLQPTFPATSSLNLSTNNLINAIA